MFIASVLPYDSRSREAQGFQRRLRKSSRFAPPEREGPFGVAVFYKHSVPNGTRKCLEILVKKQEVGTLLRRENRIESQELRRLGWANTRDHQCEHTTRGPTLEQARLIN